MNFAEFTPDQKQAWADFTLHEIHRHMEDIKNAKNELKYIEKTYGIKPRNTYVDVYIKVGGKPNEKTLFEKYTIHDQLKDIVTGKIDL